MALIISGIATLALLLILYLLFSDQHHTNYLAIIQSLTRSQDQLFLAMLLGGSVIILVAGLLTGFIMLYSSARVAGPVYRFSRNLEMEINEGPVPTIQLRKGDYLQDLSTKLSNTAEVLENHYKEQLQALEALEKHVASSRTTGDPQYTELLGRLTQIAKKTES